MEHHNQSTSLFLFSNWLSTQSELSWPPCRLPPGGGDADVTCRLHAFALVCVCVCARTCESALMASCRLHQGRGSSPDGWPRYGRNANREQECTQRISVVHTQTYTCMKNLHQEMLTLSQQSSWRGNFFFFLCLTSNLCCMSTDVHGRLKESAAFIRPFVVVAKVK